MKIKEIKITNAKRFTDLTIKDIPASAKLVVLVGPNGSGKSSIFEFFNHWYQLEIRAMPLGSEDYMVKNLDTKTHSWYQNLGTIEFHDEEKHLTKVKNQFYFRTAYRNESDFTINQLHRQNDPLQQDTQRTLNTTNARVSENYQRLISEQMASLYDSSNDEKTVKTLREEMVGKINASLKPLFNDLQLSSLGSPMVNGGFYFEKGSSKNFHYKNLSAGEKAVFDLILDLVIKVEYYSDTIFCIDEPEAHIHTKLQSALLAELYQLIPDNGQLWIATHSIGMLDQAKALEFKYPNSVIFLNFDNHQFDDKVEMRPSNIDKTLWKRFLEIALSDFSKLIAPEQVVFCEGEPYGKNENTARFDEQIYTKIFAESYPTTEFISIGSCTEVESIKNPSVKLIAKIIDPKNIIKIIDRDDRSDEQIAEAKDNNIKVLTKRNLESYLLDDEIITELCNKHNSELIEECLQFKKEKLENKDSPDDLKKISHELCNFLKKRLKLTVCGNDTNYFLRDTMAPLITKNTKIYQLLEKDIFGTNQN
jgi:predicted ATPase